MRRTIFSIVALLSLVALMNACSTAPKGEGEKTDLRKESDQTLTKFRSSDRDIAKQMDDAHGYAVFPEIGKGGAIVGGAWGRGVVYERGTPIGYCEMTQASVGAQLGGQKYSELILFENKQALERFKTGEWAPAAQASAVAAASGAGANAKYKEGVMVYAIGLQGLMAEASIGGQKFSYDPM